MSAEIIPCEGTTLAFASASSGTWTTFGEEVTSIGLPDFNQEKVPTAGLTSTFAKSRASKQLAHGDASFKLYADPNFAAHQSVQAMATNATTYWWQIQYADGKTTHAQELGPGYVSSLKRGELTAPNKNVEYDVTITPSALWALSAGSST